MNAPDQADLAALDAVMAELLPLDNYTRLRVYRQVETFFGFKPAEEPRASDGEDQSPARE